MRFLNIFKSSNNQNKRGDGNNKENNDPRAANPNSADENGQRRQTRRVNFQQGGKGGGSGRRRSFMTDLEEEDGGSEVTLTATEAGRPQQQLAPPNPYSIITEPKRNLGPRSCPGGHHQYFGDFLENDSSESAANGHHPILDRSFDAHSEFTNNQHRRSNRRRIIGGTVIGLGGGQDPNVQKFERQIPFGEIGNGPGLRRNRHWVEQREEGESSSARAASSSFARYKNLPLVDAGQAQMNARMRQMQKELTEWEFAYREERTRRKAMQRDLRREQQSKEKLATENAHLRTIIINLFLRQQPNSNGPPNLVGIDPNLLFGGLCPSSSWANHTPSTSSAVDPLPSWATPNFPNPPFVGLFPFGQKGGTAIPSSNGPGECLAQPLFSSSSLMNGPIVDGVARSSNSLEKDEIKIFRNGTDSFSGGSSRPTTGDKIEGELISEQSSRERGSFSSPEIGRSGGGKQNGGDGTFCLSFSADDCRQRELLANSMQLGEDIGQPNREDDAGYATSETTNISASMCTAMGGYEGKSAEFGKEMKTHFPAIRSSMSAETI